MKLSDFSKSLSTSEIVVLLVFIVYLIFPLPTPRMVAPLINGSFGMLAIFILVVLMFLYSNPILGVVFIFVAYELLRRSAMVYKPQPMMKHTPNERKKTQEMAKMNPPKETTLEEEVIKKMAPAQKDFIRDDSGSSFKPVYALVNGASRA
tara:strand:- start:1840 stop:2289 length:450 start_codon:yes stop_codon:yes gene_type:complete